VSRFFFLKVLKNKKDARPGGRAEDIRRDIKKEKGRAQSFL